MPAIFEDQSRFNEDASSEAKYKSLIFWDWDDTLLCSSFLSSEGYRLDTDMSCADDDLMRQLKDLEVSIIKVLETSLLKGEVIIVTNAETNWVQLSAQKFVPGVVPLLNKMQIISARSTYEGMFPDAPLKWKYCAFQDRLSGILQRVDVEKHIISFGDSHVEREAIRAVTKNCQNTKTKSIKFAERPTIEQLQRQVELATKQFQYIHSHDGDLDLCMSLSMVPTNQTNTPQKSNEANNSNGVNGTAPVVTNSLPKSPSSKSSPKSPKCPPKSVESTDCNSCGIDSRKELQEDSSPCEVAAEAS